MARKFAQAYRPFYSGAGGFSGDFSGSGRSNHWSGFYRQLELEFRGTPKYRSVGYDGEWSRVTLMTMLSKCRQSSMISSDSSRNVETV